ncbi:uroporphyrinogen-III synthase [Streptacidiphilus sp. ASG 303]|uniref:uroporphyrinogen-III synthase n=1 Tax=Streptacidiphilus sp. ASG 303 TaxID=2896847 RepID=UPI001E2EC0A6|nr:uroporphyrinogen-III synthase [Streptacidiphilus sp. ASG 303]MCD0482099.1 uroporphyrinogen-III synthase [Streptacidiphilus sp. ASG 303]
MPDPRTPRTAADAAPPPGPPSAPPPGPPSEAPSGPPPEPGPGPLAGRTVAVTADRRRGDLAALLRRRGARVVEAPTMSTLPLEDDRELRAAVEACVAAPPDYTAVTTGVGFRGWLEAAASWGLGAALRDALGRSAVACRGPKATGAVRGCGLREAYAAPEESNDDLLAWLLARGPAGRRVALQEHGAPMPEFSAALRAAGAEVLPVPVYRWGPPADPRPARELVAAVAAGRVDAVAFTSQPAVEGLFAQARELGRYDEVVAALRDGRVLAAAVGEVCARPLQAAGVPSVHPERGRLSSLVRTLEQELGARRG